MNAIKALFGTGVVASVIGMGALYWQQSALLYPSFIPEGSREKVDLPSSQDLPYDEVYLTTPDKEKMHCYIMMQKDRPETRPTVLYSHANAGNMGHRLPIAKLLHLERYNVVFYSYRGYGKSTGKPSEKGLQMDAQTVLDHILHHPVLSKTKLVLYGPSLGGAVSIWLASKYENVLSAMVIENTFTSIPDLIPTALPGGRYAAPLLSTLCKDTWMSIQRITQIKALPILFLSGRKDELVSPVLMRQLYDACTAPKEWREFRNGDHNTTVIQPGYMDALFAFINKQIGLQRIRPLATASNIQEVKTSLEENCI